MVVAMHAPDGFLGVGVAAVTGIISVVVIGSALRQSREQLKDKVIPLAGITAAFIFAAQMFNFPVAAGTTGHLLGGALAAILLGPSVGAIVVTIVVVVQALLFADGGITALGYNVLNMAIIPAYGGYAVFRIFRRWLPQTSGGVIGSTGIAAWASVVMASIAFSIEWLFGATAPVSFDDVFAAMVGVHALIGIGEGVISARGRPGLPPRPGVRGHRPGTDAVGRVQGGSEDLRRRRCVGGFGVRGGSEPVRHRRPGRSGAGG
jgi:cobalt/nickel transport system permease protein